MVATMATADAILKEVYEPRIREQLANYNRATKRMEESAEGITSDAGGKYVVFTVHIKRNSGVGACREMEALPTAQNQSYARAQVSMAYLYGSIRISGPTMKLASTNEQAFAAVLDEEVSGIQTDLKRDYNRQIWGDGTGVIVTSSGSYAVNTIPTTYTPASFEVGMVVDIYASDLTTQKASGRNVTAVTANTSVVVDGAAITTGASGDVIVRTGNISRETMGFAGIVNNSGILYNMDPATYPVWKSTVNNNGGTNRAISESLMIKMVDDIYTQGGDTTVIWTTLGVRRSYYNLLVQQRRFQEPKQFDGGFTGLGFTTERGEVPIMTDIDCQPNKMYFLNEKEFTIYQPADWQWMDEDGSRWFRVSGFDAYDATNFKYMQLGCHRRNSQGLMADITES